MAGSLDVVVRFLADASQLKSETSKIDDTGNTIKSWAKGAAAAIGGAFAVDKVVEFGKASVDAAAQDAKAQQVLATTLRNVTGASDAQIKSTEDWITKASKQYAVADDNLRPALGNLVRGFGSTEKATAAMTTALDVSAGTGKDLGSVTEAMMKAAEGNTGALGRMGVATKDASGHALSMDQIMANLATTFKGQAAAAADTTAGKMESAKIQFGEFQEQIGSALLPAVGAMASFFTNTLIPAISALSNWVGDNKDVILAAFIGFGVIVGAVVVPAFIAWAAAAGAAAIATLVAAAPFIAIGAVIAAVAFLIIKNWDSIVAATKAAWDFVLGAIQYVWRWIQANWPLLLGILLGPIALAAALIYRYWDQIKAGAAAVWEFIQGGWDTLIGFFTGLPGRLASIFSGMWDGILGAFRSVINGVIDLWNGLHFTLPKIDLGPLGKIGGGDIGVPRIPHLAQGGLMTSSGLVFAHAGEVITPAPAASGPLVQINGATFNSATDIDMIATKLEFATRAGVRLS